MTSEKRRDNDNSLNRTIATPVPRSLHASHSLRSEGSARPRSAVPGFIVSVNDFLHDDRAFLYDSFYLALLLCDSRRDCSLCRLQRPGFTPTNLRKTLVRCDWSLMPQSRAIADRGA